MLLPLAALAHPPGISSARVERSSLALTFSRAEIAERFAAADLERARELLADQTLRRARIEAGGQPCALGPAELRLVENDGVELSAPLSCPEGQPWTYEAAFLSELEPGHRHHVELAGEPVALLDRSQPRASLDAPPGRLDVALRFLGLGLHHIATGFDHLLFLFGLLLASQRLRDMLLIVSGFTIAHSLTLSAAALGLVAAPSSLIEPAIALSIVYVGLENLWRPGLRRRVGLTFALGLLHGFGFAGLLAELGLPRGSLVTALLSFNLGVELGQACIVALCLPLLLRLGRWEHWSPRAVPALSLGVALMGLIWFAERLLA